MNDLSDLAPSDEKPKAKHRLGRILSFAGVVWFLLIIAGNMGLFRSLPFDVFVGGTLFFPIALMFAGRVLRRGDETIRRIKSRADSEPTPPVLSQPNPRPEPKPKPPSMEVSRPESVTVQDLESVIGFEEPAAEPQPVEESLTEFITPSTDPDLMSSADMIEEAKRRLKSDG